MEFSVEIVADKIYSNIWVASTSTVRYDQGLNKSACLAMFNHSTSVSLILSIKQVKNFLIVWNRTMGSINSKIYNVKSSTNNT